MRSRSNDVFPPGAKALRLSEEQRQLLKRPLGRLIRGSQEDVMRELEVLVAERRGPLIVVGDVVSSTVSRFKPERTVYVTDGRTLRERTSEVKPDVDVVVKCRNDPGTISREAYEVIREAIGLGRRVHVVVDGEEDLLALAAVYLSPVGGIVVYGQPGEGVVVVEVSEEIKSFAESMLRSMVPEG